MDSEGEGGPRSEAARRRLAEDHPDWMIGRRERVFYAWYPPIPRGGNGLMVLRDATVDGLRARVEVFAAVFGQTHDRAQAEAAANDLQT